MSEAVVRTTVSAVRRLAVAKQGLGGKRPRRGSASAIEATVRSLPYVQWDPVSVVAPSHLLSLWARIGSFRVSELDRLLWKERRLLQHWIPFAAIVSAEDYPLYASYMHRYPGSLSDSWGAQRARARAFLARYDALRRRVLADLKDGPLLLGEFRDHRRTRRADGDWSPASAVSEMLWHMLMLGEVMVVGHTRNQNLWGLVESHLPSWVDRTPLSSEEADRGAATRALRGLGVATPKEVKLYFIRGCYPDTRRTLESLVKDGFARRAVVDGLPAKEDRYVLAEDVDALEGYADDAFPPRVAILPPFDNLVCDPARGKRLFGFDYVREQFLPKEKRRFGLWVLPILRGDRFVGRTDARLDKEKGELRVEALFAEPGALSDAETPVGIREELEHLARFLGAGSVVFGKKMPPAWRARLR